MFYLKQYKSPSDLINLLKSRGLVIYNDSKAINYIKRIGYYRLSAYFYPLLKNPKSLHSFKESSTFDKALMIYRFLLLYYYLLVYLKRLIILFG